MNNQEAFTTAVLAIVAQGKAAYDTETGCHYRTSDGLKCALGQLIPDTEYSVNIEGAPAGALINGHQKPEWNAIPALAGLNVYMLIALQRAHDDAAEDKPEEYFIPEFIKAAQIVATKHNLTFPTLP